jgi:flagellar motor component MotA
VLFITAGFLGQSPSALGQTIALLATFLGIGVIANVLIIYVVAQVMAERKENQEHRQREL